MRSIRSPGCYMRSKLFVAWQFQLNVISSYQRFPFFHWSFQYITIKSINITVRDAVFIYTSGYTCISRNPFVEKNSIKIKWKHALHNSVLCKEWSKNITVLRVRIRGHIVQNSIYCKKKNRQEIWAGIWILPLRQGTGVYFVHVRLRHETLNLAWWEIIQALERQTCRV